MYFAKLNFADFTVRFLHISRLFPEAGRAAAAAVEKQQPPASVSERRLQQIILAEELVSRHTTSIHHLHRHRNNATTHHHHHRPNFRKSAIVKSRPTTTLRSKLEFDIPGFLYVKVTFFCL